MNTWFAYFNDVMGLVRWMESSHKKPATIPLGLFGLGTNALAPAPPPVSQEPITGNMTAKIDSWPKATDGQKKKKAAWSAAVSNLHHVGRATRNATMHPAKNYTPRQAKEVYDATRAFMTEVAELLGAS